MKRRALVLLAAASIGAAEARAQPGRELAAPPPHASTPPAPHDDTPPAPWYGWQLLVADGAALGLGLLAASAGGAEGRQRTGDWAAATWGLGMVGSIAVHAGNRRPPAAVAAVPIRLTVPLLGGLLGMGGTCLALQEARCARDGARWGFWAGLGGAALLDAAVLGTPFTRTTAHGWYGTTTLVVDLGGLALGGLVLGSEEIEGSEKVLAAAAMHYTVSLLGAPWVHVARGHGLRALGSFGMRGIGAPAGTLFGLLGYCSATGGAEGCIGDGAAYGFLGGSLLAAAVDIGFLAWDEPRPGAPAARPPAAAPYVAPLQGGGAAAGLIWIR